MKTEQPTPRRRQQEAEKGKSFNTRDVVVVALLGAGFVCMASLTSLRAIGNLYRGAIADGFRTDIATYAGAAMRAFFQAIAPIFVVSILVIAFVSFAQSKGVIATKAIKLDLGKINPINGFKNLFSIRIVKDLVKALLYLTAIVIAGKLAWPSVARGALLQISAPPDQLGPLWRSIGFDAAMAALACVLPVVLFGAIAEYMLYIKNLKMEKFEVKQERQDNEGRPEVKKRRREISMELLNMQTRADIAGSAAILANPTHIAVGIYEPDPAMPMAFISVRESGTRALAVIAFAESIGVPVVRDIRLARRLYATSKRYTFVQSTELEPVLRLLRWLREVEATRKPADVDAIADADDTQP